MRQKQKAEKSPETVPERVDFSVTNSSHLPGPAVRGVELSLVVTRRRRGSRTALGV